MSVISLHDGSIAVIFSCRDVIELVDKYIGYDAARYLSDNMEEADELSAAWDDLYDEKNKMVDEMVDLRDSNRYITYKLEVLTDDDILKMSTEQVREIIDQYANMVQKLDEII